MKLLVVGGAGYIGSHFVRMALDAGHSVVAADNLSTGYQVAVDTRANFIKLDIRDFDATLDVLRRSEIEAVVHFAAFSLVGESMEKPLKYFDNNVGGMVSLLEAMREAGVKKIVFSSTAAVYGVPDTTPIREDAAVNPINPYGRSKLQMEQIMDWADRADGIRGIALRYFNVAGAWSDGSIGEDHQPETHLVPNVLKAALGQAPAVKIFGEDYATPDGTCIRDYIHPIDIASAHLLALDYLANAGKFEVFNLGSSTGFSVKEIIAATEKVIGRAVPQEKAARRAGDPDVLVADSRKAREVLGWQPEYDDIERIIETAWEWHKTHPKGYDA